MEVIKITYSSYFSRSFKKLPRTLQEQAIEKEKIFRKDCFDARLKTHKLKGILQGFYSFSVSHTHRILFEFNKNKGVSFVDIGDHTLYQ